MYSKVVVLIIGIPLCALLGCRAQKPVSTAFSPLPVGSGENVVPSGLQIQLKADSIQRRSANGIRFSLRIENESPDSMLLRNPLDLLSPSLLDEAGRNILYPYVPRTFINTNGPSASKSFDIDRIQVNNRTVDKTLAQATDIAVPPKGSLEFFLSIKISLRPGAEKPYTEDKTMPVPPGNYQLQMTMATMQGEKNSLWRVPPVRIRYQ